MNIEPLQRFFDDAFGTTAALTVTATKAIAVAASVAAWIAIYRRQQAPLWYALLYPLGAAVVAFIMMRSAWRGGRRVEWRGRTYRVTASEAGGHIARQRDTDHDADGR